MSGHTPGPWEWVNYPDGRKMLTANKVAVIHCPAGPMTCYPSDARLIAAAPDMLEALQAIEKSNITLESKDWLEAKRLVENAIQKATGAQ